MAMELANYRERIIQDPAIMVGKPVVKGTRVPVARVIQHLAENPDLDELFAAFPHLTVQDVQACLAFAHERLEVDWKRAKRAQAPRSHSAHA
jgi:uncharacterized protein (DUF433 family)